MSLLWTQSLKGYKGWLEQISTMSANARFYIWICVLKKDVLKVKCSNKVPNLSCIELESKEFSHLGKFL